MFRLSQAAFFLILYIGFCAFTHGNAYPQPAIAKAWNYNRLSFYENWQSTAGIDVNNTKAAGFNFYTNGAFPSINCNGSNWCGLQTAPVTPSSAIGVSSNVMTLTNTQQWQHLNTCVYNGSSVIGTAFGGGMYIDIMFSFDPATIVLHDIQWQAWWFAPLEFLNGTITNTNFVEIDGFEAYTGSGQTVCDNNCNPIITNHDWNVSNATDNFYSNGWTGVLANFGSYNFNTMHHYSILWVPQSLNSGTGLLNNYVDGYTVTSTTYSSSTGTNPALSPSNPNGSLAEMDSQHLCMIINSDANGSSPIKVGKIQVWQP